MKKKLLCITVTLMLLAATLVMNVSAQAPIQPSNLLVLGDSIATGYGLSSSDASYGKQLAAAFGLTGMAYTNLAVDGYQSADLLAQLPSDTAAIRSADTIVISIGGNDVLAPFISSLKAALGLPADATNTQLEAAIAADPTAATTAVTTAMAQPAVQAQFAAAITNFVTNFSQIISGIRAVNSTARIYVQTVYNPFSGLTGFDALSAAADTIIGSLNAVITSGASSGTYAAADIYTPFSGKAALYTNMVQFDIHPNALGHDVIFNTLYTAITGQIYAYTVTFNSNGGNSVAAEQAVLGGAFAAPSDPTRTGYTFGGWYTDSALSNAFSFSTPVTFSVTLYAKWTAASYPITYSFDGGTNSASNPTSYTYSTGLTLSDPTRDGYTFGGWYSDADFTAQVTSISGTQTGAVTLYAKWTAVASTTTTTTDGTSNPKTGDDGSDPVLPMEIAGASAALLAGAGLLLRRKKSAVKG